MRTIIAVFLGVLLPECVDSNNRTLRNLFDGTSLTYNCSGIHPSARTDAEVRLIRQYAGKVLRYEQEEGTPITADAVLTSLVNEDDTALERAVVDYMCRHDPDHLRNARFPERGSIPPKLHLPVMDEGRTSDLQEHFGQVVVFNFWATWCKPCRAEYPELVYVAREYADSGVVVYGILHRDAPDAARNWMEQQGRLPTLLDRDGAAGRAYRVRGIPHTYIIARDGTIGTAWAGYSPGALETRVREVLNGRLD